MNHPARQGCPVVWFALSLAAAAGATEPNHVQIPWTKAKLKFGAYDVERKRIGKDGEWFVTISKGNKVLKDYRRAGPQDHTVEFALLNVLGGKSKQLIVHEFTGGAHCCDTNWVLDAPPKLHTVFNSAEYDQKGSYGLSYGLSVFDLDHDGVMEISMTALSFDYFHTYHAASVLQEVVFKYDRKRKKYVPANHLFLDYALRSVEANKKIVDDEKMSIDFTTFKDEKGEYLSAVLSVALPLFYAGKGEEAWKYFHDHYTVPGWQDIEKDIRAQLDKDIAYKQITELVQGKDPSRL